MRARQEWQAYVRQNPAASKREAAAALQQIATKSRVTSGKWLIFAQHDLDTVWVAVAKAVYAEVRAGWGGLQP